MVASAVFTTNLVARKIASRSFFLRRPVRLDGSAGSPQNFIRHPVSDSSKAALHQENRLIGAWG